MRHDDDPLADVPETAHRRRDPITRGRWRLSWLVLLGLPIFWFVEYGLRGDNRYTPGLLATPHATWEASCQACHVDATPLGGKTWLAAIGAVARGGHAADSQCQTCHSGPPHHAKLKDEPGCASCHVEHLGRQADLKRVANDQCTHCHRDLGRHVQPETQSAFDNVTSFTHDHPEFRLWRKKLSDPGNVAFNHRLHMTPGLRTDPASAVPFTLQQVTPAWRERYRRLDDKDTAPVRLACASCHRTDHDSVLKANEAQAGMTLTELRGDGKAMLPIVFEKHCQGCHPLTVERKVADDPRSGLLAVRHRLQPAEMRDDLLAHYTRQFLQGTNLDLLKRPLRPLPGKNPLSQEEKRTALDQIHDRVAQAENVLYGPGTCGQCHGPLDAKKTIPPANLPTHWLPHAVFDHTAHRALDCRECHADASPTALDGSMNKNASEKKSDVLLPGIGTCQKCHAPISRTHDAHRGGARYDCVECHRYHGGDQPHQGRGAATRRPVEAKEAEGFMWGLDR